MFWFALPAKQSKPNWKIRHAMDIICVALLAEQYGPNTQYSWCGKAHLLAQGHYGLYEECITLVKNLMFCGGNDLRTGFEMLVCCARLWAVFLPFIRENGSETLYEVRSSVAVASARNLLTSHQNHHSTTRVPMRF